MNKRAMESLLLICILPTLGVTPFAPMAYADDWPMYHHDPAHTGVGSGTAALSSTLLWNFTAGAAIDSSPAVKDGVVFLCSSTSKDSTSDGEVFALNATNGNLLWNSTVAGSIVNSSPCVVDGVVYVGSFGGQRVLRLECYHRRPALGVLHPI